MSDRDESATLDLQEAVASPPSVQNDGTLLLQLIRPCLGRGKGRHVYEADMLRQNADVFAGWKMYVDHQSESERKALGGLPRSVNHLGGIVLESYWDESVPPQGRFGQGAVMGKVRPVPKVLELARLHPSLVESSINARATGVKPVQREGKQAWLVEGIEKKGTVDWVTEGGAGGAIVGLLEAEFSTPEEEEAALFDSLTDEELRARLEVERPGVLAEAAPAGDGDDGDEHKALCAKYVKAGMDPKMADKVARRRLASKGKKAQEAAEQPETDNEGGDVTKVTAEEIKEAIVTDPEVAQVIKDLVEAGIAGARDEIATQARAQAYADTDRLIEVRDLRDMAHRRIEEAKLPAAFAAKAKAQFELVEGAPTDALDVWETTDDETGEVTQSAEEALLAAVEAAIDEQRALVASLKPTRVTGQGPGAKPAGDGKPGEGGEKVDRVGPLTRSILTEAGYADPDKVYESVGQ